MCKIRFWGEQHHYSGGWGDFQVKKYGYEMEMTGGKHLDTFKSENKMHKNSKNPYL